MGHSDAPHPASREGQGTEGRLVRYRYAILAGLPLAALVALGVWQLWFTGPSSTMGRLQEWMKTGCPAVRRSYVTPVIRPGALFDVSLECEHVAGGVDVLLFESAEARTAAVGQLEAGKLRSIRFKSCAIGESPQHYELVIDHLLDMNEREKFRSWCRTLHGRMHE